ncbi:uncharacterized protein LOC129894893 [Solanum dulcamara]|uniref:uncharacterized protein LOC129894893 n=1 Tax=Solanum dulcamara TaxID=45834 RepID=UPI002485C81B|nr:uncharacterized protein LOC129894893 [Solanum dulcamara]
MGNCCKRGSNMICARDDDEWECVVAPKNIVAEKEKLFSSSTSSSSLPYSSSLSSSTIDYKEVKIRITKNELEKILAQKIDNMEEVTMEQLLSGFLNSSNISFDFENIQRQQSWRPRLQSIPEVN